MAAARMVDAASTLVGRVDSALCTALASLGKEGVSGFSDAACGALLAPVESPPGGKGKGEGEAPSLQAFPSSPLHEVLAHTMCAWRATNKFPVELPQMPVLVQAVEINELLAGMKGDVVGAVAAVSEGDADKDADHMRALLTKIELSGTLALLGFRRTVGSATHIVPPPMSKLRASFNEVHSGKKGSVLNVGARALAKHCHRSLNGWWGTAKGSEAVQNAFANEVLDRILADAAWRNIHQLPHQLSILEIRNREGYGVRWTGDGESFRGFLEPPMEGGHEQGWRHD